MKDPTAVIRRGAAGYEALRRSLVANARLPERYPAAIVRAQSPDEVADAVRWARDRGSLVTVRSGGHSWWFSALREDAVLIDVSGLDHVHVDPSASTASVGPGIRAGRLSSAIEDHGLGFPVGHSRDVGLGGYLLSGGLGWNGGMWGPACHSVRAAEMVNAEADRVRADEKTAADLLWAARGAGPGFFSVVTGFELQLYEAPLSTLSSTFAFPLAALSEVAAWIDRLIPGLDRRLEVSLAFARAPAPLDDQGISGRDAIVVVTAVAFGGSRAECEALLAPLMDEVGRRAHQDDESHRESPQHALYDLTGERMPAGRNFAADCIWSEATPAELFETLGAALTAAPSPESWMLVTVSPSQPPAVPPTPSAFSKRARFYVSLYAVWPRPEQAPRNTAWLRATMTGLDPLASGTYVGEADLWARPEKAEECYSASAWQRLHELRARHDPEGRFAWFPESRA